MGLKERMLEAIRAKNPDKAASIDLATVTDDALETAYREAVATPPAAAAAPGAGAGFVTLEDLRMVEARFLHRRGVVGTDDLVRMGAVDDRAALAAGDRRRTSAAEAADQAR